MCANKHNRTTNTTDTVKPSTQHIFASGQMRKGVVCFVSTRAVSSAIGGSPHLESLLANGAKIRSHQIDKIDHDHRSNKRTGNGVILIDRQTGVREVVPIVGKGKRAGKNRGAGLPEAGAAGGERGGGWRVEV